MNTLESYRERMDAITENYARYVGYSEIELRYSARTIRHIANFSIKEEYIKETLLQVAKDLDKLEKLNLDIWEHRALGGYAESALSVPSKTEQGLVSTEAA